MPSDETPETGITANPGYAASQIAKALTTSESHEDTATRTRAEEKVKKWTHVLAGMLSGKLVIGTRQPVREIPVWATPEVVTGGFATGRLLAGGPLQHHEEDLLARMGTPHPVSARLALNGHFLTETGLAELTERLRSGCYDLAVPEEGALLVVAWLLDNGHLESARNVVDAIAPHFAALRFFPLPAEKPFPTGGRVHLQNVGETLDKIRRIQPNRLIATQREAIEIWTPLYDQMIALFLETVDGDTPTIQPDAEGRWTSPVTRKFNVIGGRPCQRHSPDWQARATEVLSDCERMKATHRLCGKPQRTTVSPACSAI